MRRGPFARHGWQRVHAVPILSDMTNTQTATPNPRALSESYFSHDQQLASVLHWLRVNHADEYAEIVGEFPEIDSVSWSGSHFDTDAMGVDLEWSQWLTDAVEATELVEWVDGEPFTVVPQHLAAIAEVKAENAYQLSNRASVADPDTLESPGAEWLKGVASWAIDMATELVESDDPSDLIHEGADQLVPIYTHSRWMIFTDLALWLEDDDELSGYSGGSSDMTELAGVACYLAAHRLLCDIAEAMGVQA